MQPSHALLQPLQPLQLLPEGAGGDVLHGFMALHNREYRVRVRFPKRKSAAVVPGAAGAIAAAEPAAKRAKADAKDLKELTDAKSGVNAPDVPLLWCDAALHAALQPQHKLLNQRWAQCGGDRNAFLIELKAVAERALKPAAPAAAAAAADVASAAAALPSAAFYERVVSELSALGLLHATAAPVSGSGAGVAAASSNRRPAAAAAAVAARPRLRLQGMERDMRALTLAVTDASQREHVLTLTLAADYPLTAPTVRADLPVPFTAADAVSSRTTAAAAAAAPDIGLSQAPAATQLPPSQLPSQAHSQASSLAATAVASITGVVHRFQQIVDGCGEFWGVMDDFDAHVWVLDATALRATTTRRIAVVAGGRASVVVTVDPRHPRRACDCVFFGADSVTGPLKQRLTEHWTRWDESLTPRQNLQTLMGITFPAARGAGAGAAGAGDDDAATECGVCYAYRHERSGAAPERVCDNAKCSRPFHSACLYDWLGAQPDARTSFQTVYGRCPYCEQPITATTAAAAAPHSGASAAAAAAAY